LLSERDLPLRLIEERAFIDFLGPQDEPWLRVLLAEMARFEGRRRRDLAERLAEPLPCEAPYFKRRAATRALLRLWRRGRAGAPAAPSIDNAAGRDNAAGGDNAADSDGATDGDPAPGARPPRSIELRAQLFAEAAASEASASAVLEATAARLGLPPSAVIEALFADLPGERPVHAPTPPPSPAEAALRTNLAIAQAVLMRASRVELRVEGGVRPIVRLAKLRGLLCTIAETADAPRPMLEISGPFSLFRHTLLYGRALAELLPHLAWCARFELRAACTLRGRLATVTVESGDPIFPAAPPPLFDSRLEERFARDMARLAPDWDLLREPEPVRAGSTLIFPDFLLRHRLHPERQALIEIVGFWTPDYLTAKLDKLRQAELPACILCVDEDRACAAGDLPAGMPVLPFRRRIDAAAVLRQVETLTRGADSRAA
jgi:predicted nuclease of restriction endonuclease-like RecB superfamily